MGLLRRCVQSEDPCFVPSLLVPHLDLPGCLRGVVGGEVTGSGTIQRSREVGCLGVLGVWNCDVDPGRTESSLPVPGCVRSRDGGAFRPVRSSVRAEGRSK